MPLGPARRRAGACGQRGARPGPARVMALVLGFFIVPAGVGPAKLPRRQQVTDRGGRPAWQRASGRPGPATWGASGGLLRGGVWRAGQCLGHLCGAVAAPSPAIGYDAVSVDGAVDDLCKVAAILCTCRKKLGIATRPVPYDTQLAAGTPFTPCAQREKRLCPHERRNGRQEWWPFIGNLSGRNVASGPRDLENGGRVSPSPWAGDGRMVGPRMGQARCPPTDGRGLAHDDRPAQRR
jgi:hypothetical protein